MCVGCARDGVCHREDSYSRNREKGRRVITSNTGISLSTVIVSGILPVLYLHAVDVERVHSQSRNRALYRYRFSFASDQNKVPRQQIAIIPKDSYTTPCAVGWKGMTHLQPPPLLRNALSVMTSPSGYRAPLAVSLPRTSSCLAHPPIRRYLSSSP